jgi:hypothetical protein
MHQAQPTAYVPYPGTHPHNAVTGECMLTPSLAIFHCLCPVPLLAAHTNRSSIDAGSIDLLWFYRNEHKYSESSHSLLQKLPAQAN